MGDDNEVYRLLVDGLDDAERQRTLDLITENNARALARLRGAPAGDDAEGPPNEPT